MRGTLAVLAFSVTAIAQQSEPRRAAERIRQAQYCAAVERRAQHREIERVQPVSHLTPEEDIAKRRAELDRLVTPEKMYGEIKWPL
jgi:hypothetical protein